jgi:hypothetical protein
MLKDQESMGSKKACLIFIFILILCGCQLSSDVRIIKTNTGKLIGLYADKINHKNIEFYCILNARIVENKNDNNLNFIIWSAALNDKSCYTSIDISDESNGYSISGSVRSLRENVKYKLVLDSGVRIGEVSFEINKKVVVLR